VKVADCMTPEPASLTPDDTLTAAMALMETGDFRAVPITVNGKLVLGLMCAVERRWSTEGESPSRELVRSAR
jgi:CBS domain-containing protein